MLKEEGIAKRAFRFQCVEVCRGFLCGEAHKWTVGCSRVSCLCIYGGLLNLFLVVKVVGFCLTKSTQSKIFMKGF